jgi:hypothetical protein
MGLLIRVGDKQFCPLSKPQFEWVNLRFLGIMIFLDIKYRQVLFEVGIIIGGVSITFPFWQEVWTQEELDRAKEKAGDFLAILDLADEAEDSLDPYREMKRTGLYQHLYTTEHDIPVILWDTLEEELGDDWERFSQWIGGQTVVAEGPYIWDIERFLRGLPIID